MYFGRSRYPLGWAWAFLVFAAASSRAQGEPLLTDFAEYAPSKGVSGRLKSVGSDTMNNLMTFWAEGFKRIYPNVSAEVEGKGSSTAPPALISGTANLGPMSRPMKDAEIDNFTRKFGYEPTALRVGIDMLAVFVHKDNPIKSLTLKQVDAIFSKTRKGGSPKDLATWGDLGLTGKYANQAIALYGRNSASGTYGFFKENVLQGGDFKDTVREQPGSSSVVDAIGKDEFAIGYSGIGYRNGSVKAVPIAPEENDAPIPAEPKFAYSGDYPLARLLLVYINYDPGTEMEPIRREFVKYIFSRAGQEAVLKDRCLPVPLELAREVLNEVGIEDEN